MKIDIGEWDKSEECMLTEGADIMRQLHAWLTEWYGPKCEDFEPTCFCCIAWKAAEQLACINGLGGDIETHRLGGSDINKPDGPASA